MFSVEDPIVARRIVECVSGFESTRWSLYLDAPCEREHYSRALRLADRVVCGEPLQYVIGEWGFHRATMHLDRRVLIPRPETEEMTEAAIAWLEHRMQPRVVDLGTGSGAIAIAVAQAIADAEVHATDLSLDALDVARENAVRNNVSDQISFVEGSWFHALDDSLRGRVDLVIANPPYVPNRDIERMDRTVVDHEPHVALFAGFDGLDALREIVAEADKWLTEDGALFVEHDVTHRDELETLAKHHGFTATMCKDLSGRWRWMQALRAGQR